MRKQLLKMLTAIFLIASLFLFSEKVIAEETYYQNEQEAYENVAKAIKEEPGVYPVVLRYREDGKKVEKTIYVTIAGDHTVLDDTMAIDASDVTILGEQLAKMTDNDWLIASKVKAWRLRDGATVDNILVDANSVMTKEGSYPVTFTIPDGISTTVQATVTNSTIKLSDFQENMMLGSFENKSNQIQLNWDQFENGIIWFLRWLLLILMILPLLALILQYLFTRKLVKQVVKLVIK